jgi:hypothetical protein
MKIGHFWQAERQAVRDAAKIADLEVLALLLWILFQ